VCNAFPGRVGCPNVGWSYSLNVSSLAAGSHTLTIAAMDSASVTGSAQLTFVVPAIQPFVSIDAPAANATLSGVVAVSGWAIENTNVAGPNGVASVAVLVDGTQVGTATYGGARTDVCGVFPGRVGCPNVGWSYSLNVASLASGNHTLKVVATDTAGNTGSGSTVFSTGVSPFVDIDAPSANETLSGIVSIGGWAVEGLNAAGANAITSVAVLVDGTQVGTATYGSARADVCTVLPGRPGCPNVGWSYSLNVASLATGSHVLQVVATDAASLTGSSQVTFNVGVLPFVDIEAPAANATLSGVTTIGGWALEGLNATGANGIASVAVFVDGKQVGSATYGAARGDVCAVLPGRPGCPNVGWSYSLDVSLLAAGSHTLRVVATDTANVSGQAQVVFEH
jgi:hypothetical protein